MSEYRIIRNADTGKIVLAHAKWCASFWCHFKGLQFVRRLTNEQGLIFVRNRESKSETTIHMFFMFMDIGVIWVKADGTVVDKKLAKKWRPYYASREPAQYFVEANISMLARVDIGDKLIFEVIH